MNRPRHPVVRRASRALLILSTTTLLQASSPAPETAAEPAEAPLPPGAPMLFMGVDLAILHDGEKVKVTGLQRDALVVEARGRTIHVPTTGKSIPLKIDRSLKLATESAHIAKLTSERAYTPANDP